MFVKVLRAFDKYAENQIIESNKENIPSTSIDTYILNGVVQVVNDTIEKYDETDTNTQYYGLSYNGALETDLVWTIRKTTLENGIKTRITYHNVAWSDRWTL